MCVCLLSLSLSLSINIKTSLDPPCFFTLSDFWWLDRGAARRPGAERRRFRLSAVGADGADGQSSGGHPSVEKASADHHEMWSARGGWMNISCVCVCVYRCGGRTEHRRAEHVAQSLRGWVPSPTGLLQNLRTALWCLTPVMFISSLLTKRWRWTSELEN